MPPNEQGYSAAEARALEMERWNALPVVVRCLFCPRWKFSGPSEEAREKALQHRREAHPETFHRKRRHRRHLGFRQPKLKPEEEREILEERLKRARLLGIEDELEGEYTVRITSSSSP